MRATMHKSLLAASALALLAAAQPATAETLATESVATYVRTSGMIHEANATYSRHMMNYLMLTTRIEEMSSEDLDATSEAATAMIYMINAFDSLCDIVREIWGPTMVDNTRCNSTAEDLASLEQDRAKVESLRARIAE